MVLPGNAAVTVVVPVFNRGTLLGETLDRIEAQTSPAAEIIVVDDGSTDDTPATIEGYSRRWPGRLRVIRIENSGDLAARNVGLRAARTALVAFCDSDDLWEPEFIASMAALWAIKPDLLAAYADFIEVGPHAGSAPGKFAQSPAAFWDDLRTLSGTPALGWLDRPFVARLLAYQPFFPSALVVARDRFLALGGWDESVSRIVGGDFATALRIAEHPPVGVCRRPLVGIRKHGGNFSADVLRMNLGDARVLETVLAARPSLAEHEPAMRASVAARRRQAFDAAFAQGDFTLAAEISGLLRRAGRRPGGVKHRAKHRLNQLPPVLRDPICRGVVALLSEAAPHA